MEQLDLKHHEAIGTLEDVEVVDGGSRARIGFQSDDKTYSDYKTWRFALSQLLKFADLRKSELKDDEGELLSDAGDQILEAVGDRNLVFKFNRKQNVIGIVSEKFASISSGEVDQTVRETITSMGVSDFDVRSEGGLTSSMDYTFDSTKEVESVGDVVRGGIHVRNSVFGASALRVNTFYVILACSNGMKIRETERTFNQIHMGSEEEIREALVEEVEEQIESIWNETDLIDTLGSIEIEVEDQIEFIETLAENRTITKQAAGVMIAHIVEGAGQDVSDFESDALDLPSEVSNNGWNTGRENAWGLINAFTGYTTHSELSSESTINQLERVYNRILQAEDADDLWNIAE